MGLETGLKCALSTTHSDTQYLVLLGGFNPARDELECSRKAAGELMTARAILMFMNFGVSVPKLP